MGLRFNVHVYDLKFFFLLLNGVATVDTSSTNQLVTKPEKGKRRREEGKAKRSHYDYILP